MNATLFRSWHGAMALVIVVGFCAWMVEGGHALGAGPGSNRDFLLYTGWASLGLFVVVMAYVGRKYAHKLGLSPEFRLKMPIANLERAERRLGEIRGRVLSGALANPREIQAAVTDALRAEGVHRILRAAVHAAREPGDPPFIIEMHPTEPLGRMARWMHAHLYYGTAAAVLVWLHGGGAFDSTAARLLNGLSLLVIASGLVGIVFWTFGPAWLTRRERDLSIEKAYALDESLKRKVRAAYDVLDPALRVLLADVERGRGGFHGRARKALAALGEEQAAERADFQDALALLGQRHEVEKELRALWRIKMALNLWRVVHIPAAVLLAAVIVVHVVAVLWY